MHSYTTLALSALSLVPATNAWGVLGHATVATIADNYLTPAAKTYVSGILGKGVTMASVASWADAYRETTAGSFSAPYQYFLALPLSLTTTLTLPPASLTQKTPPQRPAPST